MSEELSLFMNKQKNTQVTKNEVVKYLCEYIKINNLYDNNLVILDDKLKPNFPDLTINDIIGNMKIIDKWKN